MIYLDNSATTRAFDEAVDAVCEAMRTDYFNPSALYHEAVATEKRVAQCRMNLTRLLEANAVLYTSGGTEADNLAVLGIARRLRGPRRILLSAAEHPAVLGQRGALEVLGHDVRVLALDAQGLLDLGDAEAALSDPSLGGPALVSVMQVSNETGAIQPLAELVALMRRLAPDALLHVDGVQGFLRLPIKLGAMGVDLYSISGHKIHGPRGIGALALGGRVRPDRLAPLAFGGGQEQGARPGTENTPAIFGLDAAIARYRSIDDSAGVMRGLKLAFFRALETAVPDLMVNGPDPASKNAAPHILNVSLPGVRGEVLLHALESHGVLVGTGSACSSRKRRPSAGFEAMGIPHERAERAVRVSLSPLNTQADMEQAARAFVACFETLKPYQRR